MSIFLKKSLAVYFSTYSSEEFKSGSDNSNVIWVAMNFVFIAVSYSWHVKSQVPMSTLEKKKKKNCECHPAFAYAGCIITL